MEPLQTIIKSSSNRRTRRSQKRRESCPSTNDDQLIRRRLDSSWQGRDSNLAARIRSEHTNDNRRRRRRKRWLFAGDHLNRSPPPHKARRVPLPLLLLLLKLSLTLVLTMSQESTGAAFDGEVVVEKIVFLVPAWARIGERVKLVCNYSLNPGQTLNAMKLFKDDQEIYRVTPLEGGMEYEKQTFPVDGIQLDLINSNKHEIVLKNINKLSAGDYKCQVIVEGSFKSMSLKKRMEIKPERMIGGQSEVVAMGIVGNTNYTPNQNSPSTAYSRQQQQRHAANRKIQLQQQQHLNKQHHFNNNQFSSISPAVQRSLPASSSISLRENAGQLAIYKLVALITIILAIHNQITRCLTLRYFDHGRP